MFYKFDTTGLFCGTSQVEGPYMTTVAPPDENVTAKWVWNHVDWVAMPLSWVYIPALYVEPKPKE